MPVRPGPAEDADITNRGASVNESGSGSGFEATSVNSIGCLSPVVPAAESVEKNRTPAARTIALDFFIFPSFLMKISGQFGRIYEE
jgi:hypothetical protein